jgi:hypothetical protein
MVPSGQRAAEHWDRLAQPEAKGADTCAAARQVAGTPCCRAAAAIKSAL